MTFATASLSLLLYSRVPAAVDAFHCSSNRLLNAYRSSTLSLGMGLYDSPLPPRPFSQNGPPSDSSNDDDSDDATYGDTPPPAPHLFSISRDGSEVNGRLPPIKGRTSTDGADDGPKYGEQEPKVINIVRELSVLWEDAAWALEAYQGDLDKAWIAISIQKRKNGSVALPEASGIDWDSEFARLSKKGTTDKPFGGGTDGGERNLAQDQFKRGFKDFFTKSVQTGSRDWLPTKNPQPDEDEPWFTG